MSVTDEAKKIVAAPAVAVEAVVEATAAIVGSPTVALPLKRAGDFWHRLGPGLTTGAADDDPAGIATYSQAGAAHGWRYLWLAWLTWPLMAVVQEMCARIGLATGRGLAANIRAHLPRPLLYLTTLCLLVANIFNLGADLGAMAAAGQLIWPSVNYSGLLIVITVMILIAQIFFSFRLFAGVLKWLTLVLLAYVLTAFFINNLDWQGVWRSAVTINLDFDRSSLMLVAAVLGTTISPYLFFWQTAQEVEDEISEGQTTVALRREAVTPRIIKNMRLDVWLGMFFSNLVMFFIILVTGATLFQQGITEISSSAEAAAALRPLAGDRASWLFSLGIIGTGLLAVPILSGSAAYALSESFGWRSGLNRRLKSASAFYGVIILATLVGFGLNFLGIDPIKALIYSAIANGLIAPLVLAQIVLLASRKTVMGDWVNGFTQRTLGWLIVGLMSAIGFITIIAIFAGRA